jgi:hypothetical protein
MNMQVFDAMDAYVKKLGMDRESAERTRRMETERVITLGNTMRVHLLSNQLEAFVKEALDRHYLGIAYLETTLLDPPRDFSEADSKTLRRTELRITLSANKLVYAAELLVGKPLLVYDADYLKEALAKEIAGIPSDIRTLANARIVGVRNMDKPDDIILESGYHSHVLNRPILDDLLNRAVTRELKWKGVEIAYTSPASVFSGLSGEE